MLKRLITYWVHGGALAQTIAKHRAADFLESYRDRHGLR